MLLFKINQLLITVDAHGRIGVRVDVRADRIRNGCGTVASYRRGCKCEACYKASSEYHKAHKTKPSSQIAYRERNSNKLKEAFAKHYHKNPEYYKLRHSEWVAKNKTHVQQYAKRWRNSNKNSVVATQLKRQERCKLARGTATPLQIAARMAYFGNICAYCAGPFEHVEHAIPLCRGGTNWPANLRPSCARCNFTKGRKTIFEFLTSRALAVNI